MTALFPNLAAQVAFVLLFLSIYYLEIVNQAFIAIKNRGFTIKKRADGLSLFGIYFCGIFAFYTIVAIGLLRANEGIGFLPPAAFYIGISLVVAGEALRQWSTYTLGRFFTGPVVIISNHKLIIKGPYRFVRHPGYLGGLISYAGLGLVVQSWIAPLAAMGILTIAYTYRILLEERALRQEFGKSYLEYSKKTSAIIPRLI